MTKFSFEIMIVELWYNALFVERTNKEGTKECVGLISIRLNSPRELLENSRESPTNY